MALTDASGQTLSLSRPPQRIVSLVPSITETLFRLGLADAVIGVTAYCVEPRAGVAGKTKVGGQKNPKLEVIRDLSPDLVIANIEENLEADVAWLRAAGIAVWVTYPRTVAAGIQMVRELGQLTGARDRAEPMAADLEARLAAARARAMAREPVDVFYPIWRNPYMTVSADTYIHDMLTVCGGHNVFADRADRYPTITLDEMAARRPAVIVLPDEPFRFRKIHLDDLAPYSDVPAVRDGRVHLTDGRLFCWYGPRIAEALETVPLLLEGTKGSRP
jgi:ABC-type Fe3+-hydroxamate transport system substrate-binding protein